MSALSLDHIALVTPDLTASMTDYETLGFTLTRESSHKGRVVPDGPVVPWGSGNHCAMFRQGYFEILGLTDPSRYHEHFDQALQRFHGVSLVALRCRSADALYEERKDRVGLKAPIEVGRDVPHGASTKEGSFRIVHLADDVFPEAELLFIEHETPDVLWQDSLLEHSNKTVALEGITFCSDVPEETAARLERCTGLGGKGVSGRPTFTLAPGIIDIATPADIADNYPEAVLPAVPSVAVVRLKVSDMDATTGLFEGAAITAHPKGTGRWIRPERTGGVILEFVS